VRPRRRITSRRARWTPILEGAARKAAFDIARDILLDLGTTKPKAAPVANMEADHALLLAEAARVDGLPSSQRLLRQCLARAVRQAARRLDTPASLYGGLAGLGFVIEAVRSFGDTSVTGSNEIDRSLLANLSRTMAREAQWDLVGGVVGLGVYLLARLPRHTARLALTQLVRRLQERAERVAGGVAWRTPRRPPAQNMLPGGILDLGVAHGNAGVVALLAQLHAHRIPGVRSLLRDSTEWLRTQQLPHPGACFPTHSGQAQPARSGWCYGDPGVAVALFAAARELGSRDIAEQALAIARRAAVLSVDAAGVEDAGLCHGSAGLAHIYNRLYQASGDDVLRDASVVWFRRAMESRNPGRGAAGFLFMGRPNYSMTEAMRLWPDRSLVNGTVGVGLALVSAVASAPPAWDRLLLLAIPE
jgi:lantibiotic modifying enzyme